MMNRLVFLLLFFFSLSANAQRREFTRQIRSTDGNYQVNVFQESRDGKNSIFYSVSYKNKEVVLKSLMEMTIDNKLFESALAIANDPSDNWFENLEFKGDSTATKAETWKPLYGERSTVNNSYNELVLKFEKFGEGEADVQGHGGTSYDRRRSYKLELVFRVYNEGVAFKYQFPENANGLFMHIKGERSQFRFPGNTKAYYERWAQGPYELLPLKGWPDESERPLTLKLQNGLYVSLLEAAMVDYARTKFRLNKKEANTIETTVYGAVDVITPYSTPWRVIMVGETPGELLQNNDIVLNLNAENEIENTSWIKPGKVIRSGLSTREAKECIDFACERNLQYVHLDAGWYGPEMKMSSSALEIAKDKDIRLQEIVNYGATKGIGIILYVNQRALFRQIDELFPRLQAIGIKGVKFGFVQIGSQMWTNWLHDAVKKAAKYQLLVNIHDEYRPTGFSRTYPNLLTQEGIRGNEEMPDATHNVTLPFTRYLAGAGDYTICYYSTRIKTTHAHQLALSVVTYSPLQYLYWYDSPALYKGEKEIEFFDNVKTVWDDSRVVNGEIAEYISMARRSGDEWYLGVLTNNNSRKVSVPLSFLESGVTYLASVYTDEPSLKTRTNVKTQYALVNSSSIYRFNLQKSGGAAVRFKKATDRELEQFKENRQSNF
jgi:alpha-glucosidase